MVLQNQCFEIFQTDFLKHNSEYCVEFVNVQNNPGVKGICLMLKVLRFSAKTVAGTST